MIGPTFLVLLLESTTVDAAAGEVGGFWEDITQEIEVPAFWPRRYLKPAQPSTMRVLVEVLDDDSERSSRATPGEVELGYISLHGFLTETEEDPAGVSHLLEHLAVHSISRRIGASLFSTDERYTSYVRKVSLSDFKHFIPEFVRGIIDVDIDVRKILIGLQEIYQEWKSTPAKERLVSLSREIVSNAYYGREIRDREGSIQSLLGYLSAEHAQLVRTFLDICEQDKRDAYYGANMRDVDFTPLQEALAKYKERMLTLDEGALVVSVRRSEFREIHDELAEQLKSLNDFVLAKKAKGSSRRIDEEPWVKKQMLTSVAIETLEETAENSLNLDFELPEPEVLNVRQYAVVADLLTHHGEDSLAEVLEDAGVRKIVVKAPRVGERTFTVTLTVRKDAELGTVVAWFFQYIERWKRGELTYESTGFAASVASEIERWEETSDDAAIIARNWCKYGLRFAVIGSQKVAPLTAQQVTHLFAIFTKENMNARFILTESLASIKQLIEQKGYLSHIHYGMPFKLDASISELFASPRTLRRHLSPPSSRVPRFVQVQYDQFALALASSPTEPWVPAQVVRVAGNSEDVKSRVITGKVRKWRVEVLYTTDVLKKELALLLLAARCVELALAVRLSHATLRGIAHGAVPDSPHIVIWAEGAWLPAVAEVLVEYVRAIRDASDLCIGDQNWVSKVQTQMKEFNGPAAAADALRSLGNVHPLQNYYNLAKSSITDANFQETMTRSLGSHQYLRINAVGPSTSDVASDLLALRSRIGETLGGLASWGDAEPNVMMMRFGPGQLKRVAGTRALGMGLNFVAGTSEEAAARIVEYLLSPRNLKGDKLSQLRRSVAYKYALLDNVFVRVGTLLIVNTLPDVHDIPETVEKTLRLVLNRFVDSFTFEMSFQDVRLKVYNSVYSDVISSPPRLRDYILQNSRHTDVHLPEEGLKKLGQVLLDMQTEDFVPVMQRMLEDRFKVFVQVVTDIAKPIAIPSARRAGFAPHSEAVSTLGTQSLIDIGTPPRVPAPFGIGLSGGFPGKVPLPLSPESSCPISDKQSRPQLLETTKFRRKRTKRRLIDEFEESC